MRCHTLQVVAFVCGLVFANGFVVQAVAAERPRQQKNASDADNVVSPIDLKNFPVMPGAVVRQQNLASLGYEAPGSVVDAFRFQLQELNKLE